MPDRPRPGVVATTGQHPVARTRETGAGPHGTAPIPVVRPAAARTPQPSGEDRRVLRPAPPADPPRRRLRVEPPAAEPRTAPLPVARTAPARTAAPAAPETRSGRRAATRPPEHGAAYAPRRVVRPAAPPPAPPVVGGTAPRSPRRPARVAFALLAVAGMVAISGLPSIAETVGTPPVAGVHLGDDLQQFHVADDVTAADAGTDTMSGTLPVLAPAWVLPLQGELRDGFGPRLAQPVAGVSLFHRGQDIGGGCGAAIHAAAAGTVETAQWWGSYGNWVLIDHGQGVETGYAHQQRMVVSAGQVVKAGQVIGYEGNTGASTGCHLHLEVHLDGVAVNPVPFFAAKGVPLG